MSKELKNYTEEQIEEFFNDEGIEFDDLYEFLMNNRKGGKMSLSFNGEVITIKMELDEL